MEDAFVACIHVNASVAFYLCRFYFPTIFNVFCSPFYSSLEALGSKMSHKYIEHNTLTGDKHGCLQ